MRKVVEEEKRGEIIEVTEEVTLPGIDIILEVGDQIEVFEAEKKKKKDDDEDMEDEDEDEDEEEEKKKEKPKKEKE